MKSVSKLTLLLALIGLSASGASAALIAEWDYPGTAEGNAGPLAPSTVDATLAESVSPLDHGPGLNGRGGLGNMVFDSQGSTNDADDYWTFTIDPVDTGVTLESVSVNMRTNSDPDSWHFNLYSSISGGAPTSSQQVSGSLGSLTIDTSSGTTGNLTAALDSTSFGKLTGPVTFYLQIAATQGGGAYNQFDFFGFDAGASSQISVEGFADPIPEPSAGLLILSGIVCLCASRRRWRGVGA